MLKYTSYVASINKVTLVEDCTELRIEIVALDALEFPAKQSCPVQASLIDLLLDHHFEKFRAFHKKCFGSFPKENSWVYYSKLLKFIPANSGEMIGVPIGRAATVLCVVTGARRPT